MLKILKSDLYFLEWYPYPRKGAFVWQCLCFGAGRIARLLPLDPAGSNKLLHELCTHRLELDGFSFAQFGSDGVDGFGFMDPCWGDLLVDPIKSIRFD